MDIRCCKSRIFKNVKQNDSKIPEFYHFLFTRIIILEMIISLKLKNHEITTAVFLFLHVQHKHSLDISKSTLGVNLKLIKNK